MERVTKKRLNWYLRGWEYRAVTKKNGKPGRKLVYTGEYYRIAMDKKRRLAMKTSATAIYVLMCAVYLGFETTLSQGGFVWYAGAPCLLAILPLFYLGLGVFNLAASEDCFTYRRMRAAYTRIRVGGKISALLLGLGTVGQTVFVVSYRNVLTKLKPELVMLFGALFCCACAIGLLILEKHTPYEEVDPKDLRKNG